MSDESNDGWLSREREHLADVMRRTTDPTYGPVIVRGQGSRVWDANGREFFDLTCGYSAANFGHAFEPLVRVASHQLRQLTHVTGMPHPDRTLLAEGLIKHCGRHDHDKVIFNTSGARAIETAIKAALNFRRGKVVALSPSYHGRSWMTSTLSQTSRIAVMVEQDRLSIRRPASEYAYCAACPHSLTYPQCDVRCGSTLLHWIQRSHEEISAIVVEPALGARGYVVPPAEYWQRLRKTTEQYGVLMIADEIQMGLGRTGDWLLSHTQGWLPDLVVLGKSLGGGITPISAVIGRADLLDALPAGSESETFAASPLATALGREVIHQLEVGPWFARAKHIGERLGNALRTTAATLNHTLASIIPPRVETCGASCVLEFYGCWPDLAQTQARARQVAEHLVSRGLLIHYSGPYETRIVFLPALTMSDEELDEVIERLQLTHA